MLIKKTTEIIRGDRKPHRLGKRLKNGSYLVEHPVDCECMMLHSVAHAPWVTYDQGKGILRCDRCKTSIEMPCPSVRDGIFSRTVYMDLSALEDDLWKFQLKHENCPEVK